MAGFRTGGWLGARRTTSVRRCTERHIQWQRHSNQLVCLITSNLSRAKAPGNVLLKKGEANLTKPSVVNVSQILTVNKAELIEYIGRLNATAVLAVRDGLHLLFDHV